MECIGRTQNTLLFSKELGDSNFCAFQLLSCNCWSAQICLWVKYISSYLLLAFSTSLMLFFSSSPSFLALIFSPHTFFVHKQDVKNNMNQSHFVSWPPSLWALSRCQDGSGSSSGNAPPDQKFLLKWSVPLSFVDVLEFGSSEDMAENTRYTTPHSGEKVVINAKPSMNQHSVKSAILSVCGAV